MEVDLSLDAFVYAVFVGGGGGEGGNGGGGGVEGGEFEEQADGDVAGVAVVVEGFCGGGGEGGGCDGGGCGGGGGGRGGGGEHALPFLGRTDCHFLHFW